MNFQVCAHKHSNQKMLKTGMKIHTGETQVHVNNGGFGSSKATSKCDFTIIFMLCHQIQIHTIVMPFLRFSSAQRLNVSQQIREFHKMTFFMFLGPAVSHWFPLRPTTTAHVQVLENKTKRGAHKKGVWLSHLVIHRKQASCSSNHTSASTSSVSAAESSANRRQDSRTVPPLEQGADAHRHRHTHTKRILRGIMAAGSKCTSNFFHLSCDHKSMGSFPPRTSEASGLMVFINSGSSWGPIKRRTTWGGGAVGARVDSPD